MRSERRGLWSEVRGRREPHVPPTSDLMPPTSGALRKLLLGSVVLLSACEWFHDFKRQPSVWTWEPIGDSLTVRASPQGSVPTTGTAMAGYQVSYTPGIAQIESLAVLTNPVPVSDSSLANGRKYYQINCAVCHGDRALGDGSATKYGMVPMRLTLDVTINRTDGYLFGMMRNGRGLMPPYNRIEERARWDVVNYLRALQGRIPGRTVETGPLAPPGVTGAALPSSTELGPGTWVRPVMPNVRLTPRSGAGAEPGGVAPPVRDTTRHDGVGQ